MKKESLLYGIIGLLAGIVLTGFFGSYAVNNNNDVMMGMMGIDSSKSEQSVATDHSTMSMAGMTEQLESLSGDEFDKAFIEMMIAHHEGAVDMAELIPARAKHNEIKTLGEAIITAQTKEIAAMKQWQKDWSYSTDKMMDMMHGGN